MKILVAIGICMVISTSLPAQKITINGYIKDAITKEALIGASIINVNAKIATTTNEYGFFSLIIDRTDTTELLISYIGYKVQAKKIFIQTPVQLIILMETAAVALGEVIVQSGKNNYNIQKAQMGVINVPLTDIKNLPVLLGEKDLLKVIQLLPGVQAGQEGTTGFYVRGGNSDQNLVQLDEATVYNPNHLFGLFSTFNINAINNVQLIKGGFPAEYGGRLSSVLNVSMKEGNKTKYVVEGGIGLLSNNLAVQGPLKKNKSSFIVSLRRSHIDLLLKTLGNVQKNTSYKFYDLNAKMNVELGKSDHLFLSLFKGNDYASYNNANSLNYTTDFGNSTVTLRWNHLFAGNIFSNTSVIYNDYNLGLSTSQNNYYSLLYTGIKDISAKTDFTFTPGTKHKVKAGSSFIHHRLSPASFSASATRTGTRLKINIDSIQKLYSTECAFYAGDEFDISSILGISYGIRIPFFITGSKNYLFGEPRITTKISIDQNSSIKASYTRMNQFLHLIPNSTAGLPTDIWIPSSDKTKPQSSAQYAVGYFRNFKSNSIETSVELYYKKMRNQALFGEGEQLKLNLNPDSLVVYGKGESYGAEFFVKKTTGMLTGWISYTLSKTTQQFPGLNYGKEFPFKYDRRHNVAITASYKITKTWTFSAVFVYTSGAAFTVPTARISTLNSATIFEGNYYIYEGRNNYRLAAYHRLDVSASNKKTVRLFGKTYEREWNFGLYNTYSRQNPYFIYFEINPLTNKPAAKQVSLLPVIPSVSFNFKF